MNTMKSLELGLFGLSVQAEDATPPVDTWQGLQQKALNVYTAEHAKWSESVNLLNKGIARAREDLNNSAVVRMHLNAAAILWNEKQQTSAVSAAACAYRITDVSSEYRIATLIAFSFYQRQSSGFSLMGELWEAQTLASSNDNFWALMDIRMRLADRDLDRLDFGSARHSLEQAATALKLTQTSEYHGYSKAYWAMRLELQAFWLRLAEQVVFGLCSNRDEIAARYYELSHDAQVLKWRADPDVAFVLDYVRIWMGHDDIPVKLDAEKWEQALWWMALRSPDVGHIVPAAPPYITSLPLWHALFLRAELTPAVP